MRCVAAVLAPRRLALVVGQRRIEDQIGDALHRGVHAGVDALDAVGDCVFLGDLPARVEQVGEGHIDRLARQVAVGREVQGRVIGAAVDVGVVIDRCVSRGSHGAEHHADAVAALGGREQVGTDEDGEHTPTERLVAVGEVAHVIERHGELCAEQWRRLGLVGRLARLTRFGITLVGRLVGLIVGGHKSCLASRLQKR